ncbi:MAG: [protein-PII] uridylyltransferase [Terriglobia bacterium]
MSNPSSASRLAELHASGVARIRANFEAAGDGRAAARARADLVDEIIIQLYQELISPERDGPKDFCLVAVGGYGRRELFPHSDLDLVFLSTNPQGRHARREAIATLARTLWDLRMRVGHSARTLNECSQLHRDNLEFNIALLDCRLIAGDGWLFNRLRDDAIPHLVGRDRDDLVRDLAEMTRQRHAKHGNTVFHLEPNLKEAPGGLRDYHVAGWLSMIAELEKGGRLSSPEERWPDAVREVAEPAFAFLSAARCFLHWRQERDDNLLTYEFQDQAAALGIGHEHGTEVTPADWMRTYFRHARAIDQLTTRALDETAPSRSSLYGLFQDWRSRLSNADFAVVRGRIFPRQPTIHNDPALVMSLFEMVARHGIELSREAERWVEESVRNLGSEGMCFPGLWRALGRVLLQTHPADALRAMHRLGVLVALLPELRVIDCLVVRDFYHRYTVDEHSFMTIQNLQSLRSLGEAPSSRAPGWERNFAEILSELERPDLLLLALLLHDVGKGMTAHDHVVGSLEAAEGAFERLGIASEDRETIRVLIADHLLMSATLLRRDIFDPETVRSFAETIGTTERLKMLTLLTYADVKAVNPEALTPWKAEMLWRLYASTANYLARSLDDERLHPARAHVAKADRVVALLGDSMSAEEVNAFLEGFPKRYLETHSAEEVAAHCQMARRLGQHPVEVQVRPREPSFELTVVTADRPSLFASLTGTLAAWGMNILKADAFANSAGIVLDTFRFADLFRTLELNPSEIERFKTDVIDVVAGKISVQTLMTGRLNSATLPRPKVPVATRIRFDDASSTHSTLLELVTQDRPGLLYKVSSALAEVGLNIEVALIDTEGEKVVDVFYLTYRGEKLGPDTQARTEQALHSKLQASSNTSPGPATGT